MEEQPNESSRDVTLLSTFKVSYEMLALHMEVGWGGGGGGGGGEGGG